MPETFRKIYDALSPALMFEFVYRRNHAALVSYSISVLAVCACLLFGQWPASEEAAGRHYGSIFFGMILIYMILVVTVISTAHASLSIAGEKEKKTLTLLRLSGLTPAEIIFSKAAVSLCFIVFLLLPTLPLALVCPFLGGISFSGVSQGLSILAVMTVFFVSGGLLISILFKKNYTCISFAAAFLIFIHFGFFVLDDLINYRLETYNYSRVETRYFSIFSPVEMWGKFFSSIREPFSYHRGSYRRDYFLDLSCGESAAIYSAAAAVMFFSSVKIFERYLKWRED
ncbi:MAG: hypothetical protein ACD_47C00109G0004 [uncultured bacterium]|uniref:ABC-2 type transporter transmembrane domain-containing protein n=1 Tax=Candidatus Wallbacteria bacterium GWC2_49_35 TaxID=1817813 RepID=A0A1F7WSP9_9BACT|nr:MAG: hypothetical protein ACD_47C00109G0004 [uncultured bacterium]OGM05811.1 MAG: hypothetical protein A2008_02980 [Candidatus Wallbacteria bacterium GWC2_49_35]HBC73467.1 hypothetical protein [Candidatus Wallbacteria bacterium]